ncbi:DUF4350 domain-containing protein [Luethyella okanaganae]|uniref:DUF4350 domain-containing protein n=1 Tax=Luethyella okanaganae TaxID=69372 RepID=A0ABW1V9Y7_9MICO
MSRRSDPGAELIAHSDSPLGDQSAVADDVAPSATPTVRAASRKAAYWVVAAVGTLLVGVLMILIVGGSSTGGPPLASDNPAQAGGKALAEVLRQRGVSVVAADSLAEARDAAASAPEATLFFYDPTGYLGDDQLIEMAGLAEHTVVADPDFSTLQTLAPDVGFGGVGAAAEADASCAVPAARKAGQITPGTNTLSLAGDASGSLTGCFPSGGDTYALVQRQSGSTTLTLVAPTEVFSNDTIADFGNAALALNLLGEHETLVWYIPTLADVAVDGPPSLAELTPGWVTPVLSLAAVVALAAAVWRGRRFGAIVVENLPVVVKASETMEGRARLYARNSARLRALDALRIGTIDRLAHRLGLSRTASVDEVAGSVATTIGAKLHEVRFWLVDAVPSGDAELIRLSDHLLGLEHAVERATSFDSPHNAHGRTDT